MSFHLFRRAVVALCALAGAMIVAPAQAQMSPAQRGEIESIVREYLIKNPEVLRDAFMELERRSKEEEEIQRRAAIEQLRGQIFNSRHQAVVGNPQGKITLVEFYDYNCGFCKRGLEDVARLIKENPDLRVVLKEFPVLSQGSMEAAQVASAVRLQVSPDRFWNFHHKLMSSRGAIGRAQALAVAKEVGVDMARLTRDMDGPEVKAALAETMQLGESLGINGTPSYVVGQDVVVGAVGFESLQTRIANVRKCGKSTCG